MIDRIVRRLSLAALCIAIPCSCAKAPQSATLALSLKDGMERSTRFITEQRWRGARDAHVPDLSSLAFTYRFHVISVDAAGTAKVESTFSDASIARGFPAPDALMKMLMTTRLLVTIDRTGHILAMSSDQSPGSFTGFPRLPDFLPSRTTVPGDMQSLFGSLNGRKVSVGETWTSEVSPGSGSDLPGTLHWTLASVAGTTARVEYSGRLKQEPVALPSLPTGKQATLSGDVSGYVALELDTGWPVQGRSTTNVDISVRDDDSTVGGATRMLSLTVVSKFEPAR